MPNEEREQRLSDLGKAAIGAGVAVAFFTRTQVGKELASVGVARTRNALLKSSEQLKGKTLASMWGHGADDLKRASQAFKNGFSDETLLDAKLPLRRGSLFAGLSKRQSLLNQSEAHATRLFNKEYMPAVLRKTIVDIAGEVNETSARNNRLIVDDIVTRYNDVIALKATSGQSDTHIFTGKFEKKMHNLYGDKANEIMRAIDYDLANIKTHKQTFLETRGNTVIENIQRQFNQFESYENRFKQNTFWNNLVGQQSATVRDVLNHKDKFQNQKIGNKSAVDMLQEMVDLDERFADLIVDPALKFADGKFYDYTALDTAIDKAQDLFLENVGRIIKPLEVRKHMKQTPDFFVIPKGMIDPQLQAIMEPEEKELQNSYLRMFDKTYRIENDGTLQHLAQLDDTYLTPAKGFEAQQLRHISGNVDFNYRDIIGLEPEADQTERFIFDIKKKLGMVDKVSKNYEGDIKKRYRRSQQLAAMGLGESGDLLGDYDNIRLSILNATSEPDKLNPEVYELMRSLVKDIDEDIDAIMPSMDAVEKLVDKVPMLRSRSALRDMLKSDDELLEGLIKRADDTYTTNGDIIALAKAYRDDPIEAMSRVFYHGGKKNGFIEEARRELFKEALYTSNAYNEFGSLFTQIEHAGLSSIDLKRTKHLAALSYLQNSSGISMKNPDMLTDSQVKYTYRNIVNLFFNSETDNLQDIYKRVSDNNKIKHLSDAFEQDYLQRNVSIADRPSQYVHMKKAISVLDIIEEINNGLTATLNKAVDYAGQFIAGRRNLEDVTTHTLYPYFGLFRLQNDVKKVGLNLGRDDMGSVLDLAKGITLKRALPIYALGFGASYLNYESENFFGQSFTNMAAEATAKIDLGIRSIADTFMLDGFLKDAHYWFTPLNYLQEDEYQTAEERKAFYENGYSAVRQSKFWSLGSSEFFGGKINYYQPNFVKRTQVNWQDIGVYGSSEEKWKHSLIPTLRHPLSTIRYLTNPYWLEEKHKYDRPYMVSGPMFDPSTPWGTIGNLTIGNLIKPQKRLNQEYVTSKGVDIRNIIEAENNRIKDNARSSGVISIKSSDTAIESASSPVLSKDYTTGVMSVVKQEGSGLGNYVARQEYKETYLTLADRVQVFAASLGPSRQRLLNQIEQMNYAIKEKAKWSYGNDTGFAKDIGNALMTGDHMLIQDKTVAKDLRLTTSNQDMIRDLTYSIQQLSGIYNFIGESIVPTKKRYAYARSSDMYAASNRFWQSGIDGADYGGFMEIARRFIPNEDRNRIRVNPLRNNMPSWMPSRFHNGDPYTMIKKGEMRLPGAGFEALHGLEDKSGFMINSDFIGLDAESIINRTIAANNAPSTAVSEYQQILIASGMASAINKGVYDKANNVSGAYDALINDSDGNQAVMQIRSLNTEAYERLLTHGASQQDLANVNYYLGQEGLGKGYMTYINSDTKEMRTFDVNFSQIVYERSLAAVREARKTLTDSVQKGILSPYELYDDFTRFKILADVAPGGAEYKNYKTIVQSNLSTEAQKREYEQILERVDRQSQKHRFYNYKFTNVDISKTNGVIESIGQDGVKLVGDDTTYLLAGLKNYHNKIYDYLAPGMKVQLEYEKNYSNSKYIQASFYSSHLNINRQMARDGIDKNDDGSAMATRAMLTKNQIMLGKPFETLAHMPIPFFHNKFMRVNSPYESWMQENVYGSKFSSWDNPIQTILKPSLHQAWGSNLTHGLLGSALFAVNEYLGDLTQNRAPDFLYDKDIRKLSKYARLGNLFITPGAMAGEVTERVLTLNPNLTRWTTGTGARIGSIVGLAGIAVANSTNPFVAAASGAGIGATIGEWLQSGNGKTGAFIGTAAGLAISAMKTDGFNHDKMFSEYIPNSTKERWEIEEYFDRIEYLKYKGLYEKASRLAFEEEGVNIDKILSDMDKREKKSDSKIRRLMISRQNIFNSDLSGNTKQDLLSKIDAEIDLYANPNINVSATPYVRLAIGYKQAMESTVYGLDDTSSWSQILRALEPYERDYFLEFAKVTNPREQKKILKAMDPYKRKILENAWGLKKRTRQESNTKYFKSHRLPGPLWQGWNADKDLEHYKVKTIMNEGMILSDFGYYDSEKNDPGVQHAHPVIHYDHGSALLIRARLGVVMQGMGIAEGDVSVLPSQESGIQTFVNLATVNTHKVKNVLSTLGAQFF